MTRIPALAILALVACEDRQPTDNETARRLERITVERSAWGSDLVVCRCPHSGAKPDVVGGGK